MTSAVNHGFLGTGWAFPLGYEPGQGIRLSDDGAALIRQSIGLILGTAPGERVMRPDFGCGIHDLVFDVNDVGTAGRISRSVREALARWEPRIDVLDVYAAPDPDDRRRLLIEINYQVRSTNSRFNLVYPFYLA
ncbi:MULTISPECIES: GPW/gp25 family protein [unclassified Solwaraspora]|uniref:GPW/gp25 family protein n=1 Tax=unclassified Solwaraspora TaxID=2627926 RepID=UPI00248D02F0|nr:MULTISPECIES: GPW/gp25 family protein [unclassified Solwaraspora]WBB95249.1 GPW/gp25 family protein [Solwaraspora sp. WMMA2059]WBC20845.1 GPW/gp25 family protein [Solwaraspora sp. WMMA2080]WFE21255.1 GPW/gp25 family protein [Solwaraspora sp. WMMD937]WJK37022.1 GPW/gp25 family protein [Solwaraspora sp. WMMA2065]